MKGNSKDEVDQLHAKVRGFIESGFTNDEIIESMKESGLEKYYIETLIQNVNDDTAGRKSFRNSMIMGVFYIATGLLFNVISYNYAVTHNAFYFYILWGIVVLGITTIIRGFILYKRK